MNSPSNRGRGYGNRGRRGPDRHSQTRRPQTSAAPPRSEHADVEHIMREIRTRIAQQHGVDLTDQQVQELAARRLESILDVRTVNPALIEQLRKNAAGGRVVAVPSRSAEPPYRFEETTLYDSHRGLMRVVRRLLNPILKLFFNPGPLVHALHTQARLNVEAARREAERDQRQAEWNALHYEILQRLVTEVSRVSLEAQSLGLRVESLSAKVDFNERRVRGIEGSRFEPDATQAPSVTPRVSIEKAATAPAPAPAVIPEATTGDAPRRRRRRRRGRRSTGPGEPALAGSPGEFQAGPQPSAAEDDGDVEEQEDASKSMVSDDGAVAAESRTPVDRVPAETNTDAGRVAPDARPAAHGEPAMPPAPESDHGGQ